MIGQWVSLLFLGGRIMIMIPLINQLIIGQPIFLSRTLTCYLLLSKTFTRSGTGFFWQSRDYPASFFIQGDSVLSFDVNSCISVKRYYSAVFKTTEIVVAFLHTETHWLLCSFFLEFLSSFLSEIGFYATLNTYQSAISLITANEIGSHPLVQRFYKGVAMLQPQRPRYDFIWDPSLVVDYLSTLSTRNFFTWADIKETCNIPCFRTAHRFWGQEMQTLAAIQLSNLMMLRL